MILRLAALAGAAALLAGCQFISAVDQATEPLFMAIRDALPGVRSVSPLYRTPVAIAMDRKQVLVGA